MPTHVLAYGTVIGATIATVALCVLVHYEGLRLASQAIWRGEAQRQVKVVYGIFSVLVLHAIEIVLFGLAFWLLVMWPACGSVSGASHVLDHVYLSAMTFTTVGVPDLFPVGPIRLLAAAEALAGLVLITWSASFTFVEMERFWRAK